MKWVKQADIDEGNCSDGPTTGQIAEIRRLRKEVKSLRQKNEILEKFNAFSRTGDRTNFVKKLQFVEREKASSPVTQLCQVLGVSTSGYWAWRSRPVCTRQLRDDALLEQVHDSHRLSRGCYGAPRVHADLRDRAFGAGASGLPD